MLVMLVLGIFAAACSAPAPVVEVAELPDPEVEVSTAEPTEVEAVPTDPPTEVPTEAPTNTPEPEPTEAEVEVTEESVDTVEAETDAGYVGNVPPIGNVTEDVSFVTATGRPQFLNSYADW